MPEGEDKIIVSYKYLANKKRYLLGVRMSFLKKIIGMIFLALIIQQWWLAVILLILWIIVGYTIDMRQRKITRDYKEIYKAWWKIKHLKIEDVPGGVLSKIAK